jgi:L-amino acid N-acyltransferase YncA
MKQFDPRSGQKENCTMIIRPAEPKDINAIWDLILGLAEYEKALAEVKSNKEQIAKEIFEGDVAKCHVAEVDGEVIGFAQWFLNYSTWTGVAGIYLEDLYVKPEFRGNGAGLALMKELARICVQNGFQRFQWWVLDWNEPSINFYKKIGAVAMDEWTVYRLSGEALVRFAQ